MGTAEALVHTEAVGRARASRSGKARFPAPLITGLRATLGLRESARRLWHFAHLSAELKLALPASTVVLGRTWVYGTRQIKFEEGCLLYPMLHLETQEAASIRVGRGCVFSRGVHCVAMAGITIGAGTMIGEYSSLRDANHARQPGRPIRLAGHTAHPIHIGREVWIGRGVTVLGGVTIGDGATVGANAVVTHDVPAGSVVAGVPAREIRPRET